MGGVPTTLADGAVIRDARVTNGSEVSGSYGADRLLGGGGPDELHGQRDTERRTAGGTLIAGDQLEGGLGDDVLIGDLGRVVTVLEDGSRALPIRDSSPFLDATLRAAGTRTRQVTLFMQHDADHVEKGDGSDPRQFGAEGDDVLLGGGGSDAIHGGSGDDTANGGEGPDVVFGGDGKDAAWGGPGVDELFGGHDADSLDVAPRGFVTGTKGIGPRPGPGAVVRGRRRQGGRARRPRHPLRRLGLRHHAGRREVERPDARRPAHRLERRVQPLPRLLERRRRRFVPPVVVPVVGGLPDRPGQGPGRGRRRVDWILG